MFKDNLLRETVYILIPLFLFNKDFIAQLIPN